MADRFTDYAVNSERWLSLEDFVEGEVWKDIEEYETEYQVSSVGRVKLLKNNIILRCFLNRGYVYVTLSKQSVETKKKVHRLVATAFIPNPDNLPDVNHIDENKTNNCRKNLEWCSKEYNRKYGTAIYRSRCAKRKCGCELLSN